jgi:hypothetical protein
VQLFFQRSHGSKSSSLALSARREAPILTVRFILQSVAACLLSACAAEPVQPVWVKDGASQSDFDKDRRACTLALNQRPLGVTNQNLYDTCMSRARLEPNGASRDKAPAKFALSVLILRNQQIAPGAVPVSRPQKEDNHADEGDGCQQSGGIEGAIGHRRVRFTLRTMSRLQRHVCLPFSAVSSIDAQGRHEVLLKRCDKSSCLCAAYRSYRRLTVGLGTGCAGFPRLHSGLQRAISCTKVGTKVHGGRLGVNQLMRGAGSFPTLSATMVVSCKTHRLSSV